jgi:hypothetical protein
VTRPHRPLGAVHLVPRNLPVVQRPRPEWRRKDVDNYRRRYRTPAGDAPAVFVRCPTCFVYYPSHAFPPAGGYDRYCPSFTLPDPAARCPGRVPELAFPPGAPLAED